MADPTVPTVSDLLAESLAAHLRYRALGSKRAPGALEHMQEAARLRAQAHTADPEHTDPVWAAMERTSSHDALTAFYQEHAHGG